MVLLNLDLFIKVHTIFGNVRCFLDVDDDKYSPVLLYNMWGLMIFIFDAAVVLNQIQSGTDVYMYVR